MISRRYSAESRRTGGAAAGRYAAIAVLVAALVAALALAVAGPAGALPSHVLWSDIWSAGPGIDQYKDAAPTIDGGFVAAGVTNDSSSGDGADIVVAKFAAANGAPSQREWVRTWDNPFQHRFDTAWAIATDLDGGVIASGYTNAVSGRRDWVIVKWNASGAFQWSHTFGPDLADGRATAMDVCCDGAGDVYVCGSTQTASNAASLVVRKLDAGSGDLLWRGDYSGPAGSFNEGVALVLDDHLNAYVTGYSGRAGADRDIILVKFHTGGASTPTWARRIDSGRHLDDEGVALKMQGSSLYVVGGMFTTNATRRKVALARYTTAGTRKWLRTWRDAKTAVDNPAALAVDKYGGVAVAGFSDFASGQRHAFLVKWNKSGTRKWAKVSFPSPSKVRGYTGVVGDPAGHLWVGGYTKTGDGNSDWLVARYEPDGRRAWISQWNGSSGMDDFCSAIGLTVSGKPFAVGSIASAFTADDAAAAKYRR